MTTSQSKEVISYIDEGTVIDHIPATKALALVSMLKIDRHVQQVSIGINLPSTLMGKKDMIKVQKREFSPEEINCIALFAPEATISIIRNYEVSKKFQVAIPDRVDEFTWCPNPQCITKLEKRKSSFKVKQTPLGAVLSCNYCCKTFTQDEL